MRRQLPPKSSFALRTHAATPVHCRPIAHHQLHSRPERAAHRVGPHESRVHFGPQWPGTSRPRHVRPLARAPSYSHSDSGQRRHGRRWRVRRRAIVVATPAATVPAATAVPAAAASTAASDVRRGVEGSTEHPCNVSAACAARPASRIPVGAAPGPRGLSRPHSGLQQQLSQHDLHRASGGSARQRRQLSVSVQCWRRWDNGRGWPWRWRRRRSERRRKWRWQTTERRRNAEQFRRWRRRRCGGCGGRGGRRRG
mmetsp:Transcript_33645/g.88776  ORF Transcript_33645/g.88776 Transcript_33645/m.88776 type:complete len:254 (+) Transcript_33645:444-1205(+)